MEAKEISKAVISRLPRYYRYLAELKNEGIERISSQELSRMMHVTASQIRQDFNNFGGFGQQGYGYNTNHLYEEIGKILGLDEIQYMILIGAGNLGQAIIKYMHIKKRGFYFKGAFDIDPAIVGTMVDTVPILPMDQISSFVEQNSIDIAVLTVPKDSAREAAAKLYDTGIKAIWNFAHVDLDVPSHIEVENVHLYDSLMKLSYNLHKNER